MRTGADAEVAELLELRGIGRRFGPVTVLSGIDLRIGAGEICALVGENGAGKSTLMRILCGALSPDAGSIVWQGQPVRFASPRDARALGIAMIHQELALVPELSVAENVCLGEERPWWQPVDFRQLEAGAATVLARLGERLDPRLSVGRLNLSERQLVEVARALYQRARLLILDEPTAALGEGARARLFAALRRVRDEGTAIIYISHRLEEIFELCGRIAVLRNGQLVHSGPLASLDEATVVRHMVGRPVSLATRQPTSQGQVALTVRNLDAGPLRGINFDLAAGEVLGVVGLAGAGRSRLLRALFGVERPTGGSVALGGAPYAPRSPREALRRGVCLLGEDRKRHSLVPWRPVRENMALASLGHRHRFGVVHSGRERSDCQDLGTRLRLRCASQEEPIRNLSGGNQQKALLARLMLTGCRVLLLDEPTRGVDIEAKVEIYNLIDALAAAGSAVLVVSSDLGELMQLCERLVVLRGGRLVAESHPPYDAQALLALAMGVAPGD